VPFTPDFDVTFDEGAAPGSPSSPPLDNDCLVNLLPPPNSHPCEQKFDYSSGTGTQPGDETSPFHQVESLPQPKYYITSSHPTLGGLTNGTQVGVGSGTAYLDAGSGCTLSINVSNLILKDGALPAPTGGFDDDGDGSIDEDPFNGLDDDVDTLTDEDGNSPLNGMPAEGPNDNTGAALSSPSVWPTRLNSDSYVQAFAAAGYQLWSRYTGEVGGVRANLLVFNTGPKYLQLIIIDDPTFPPPVLCGPYTRTMTVQGLATDLATTQTKVIRSCTQTGPAIIGASMQRGDSFEVITLTATSQCSADTDNDLVGDAQDNCPSVSNPTQRNMVHAGTFAGDHCEDPELDGVFDITDNCPDVANTNQANADGDEYGDVCDTCPAVVNHWTVGPADTDCDGYGDTTVFTPRAAESTIGTVASSKCSANNGTDNEPLPDAWPPDFNDNQLVNGADILHYNFAFGQPTTNPPVVIGGTPIPLTRFDLNGSGLVNGADVLQLNPFFGKRCDGT
jgi:hypothetical protein